MLMPRIGYGRQDAFDIPASGFAVGSKASSAPQHARPNGVFGGIVRPLFVVGDASRDVLQVVVAAGECSEAAVTVNTLLLKEDLQ